jgi:hypothetical protein
MALTVVGANRALLGEWERGDDRGSGAESDKGGGAEGHCNK